MYVIYVDGSSENPGLGVSVAIVEDKDTGKVLTQEVKILEESTCNEAEYNAIKLAIDYITNITPQENVTIYSDSMLAVNQLNGSYKIKNPTLYTLNEEIKNIIKDKQLKCTIEYVPREQNVKADFIAHTTLQALVEAKKKTKKNKKKEVKKHGKRKPRSTRSRSHRS